MLVKDTSLFLHSALALVHGCFFLLLFFPFVLGACAKSNGPLTHWRVWQVSTTSQHSRCHISPQPAIQLSKTSIGIHIRSTGCPDAALQGRKRLLIGMRLCRAFKGNINTKAN